MHMGILRQAGQSLVVVYELYLTTFLLCYILLMVLCNTNLMAGNVSSILLFIFYTNRIFINISQLSIATLPFGQNAVYIMFLGTTVFILVMILMNSLDFSEMDVN